MKFVGLVSGGKDSCYNMMQCVAEGHELIALANLKPKDKDELDSYMFQTVGHHAINLYAEALGVPLFQHYIEGSSISKGKDYELDENDEVEDLFKLLSKVKDECKIEAVSVGAILSDYQRVRVENVCSRLGLVSLAYLWRRDQVELMKEMINCKVEAIIIKVAAMGLKPKEHLRMSIDKIFPIMLKLKDQFGLNVCGEGGEFETFTLDCPLFKKRIIIDDDEEVMHSDDPICPVGYINFRKMHLEDKNSSDAIASLPLTRSSSILDDMFIEEVDPPSDTLKANKCLINKSLLSGNLQSHKVGDHLWLSEFIGKSDNVKDISAATKNVMKNIETELKKFKFELKHIVMMHLYISDMSKFAEINNVYKTYFGLNPPARICVAAHLPDHVELKIDCYASLNDDRKTMHVQGLSHWAPANIGPYSQSVQIGSRIYVAGQIAMCPADLSIIKGGIRAESRLSLRHVKRILNAMHTNCSISDVVVCICYVVDQASIPIAQAEWRNALSDVLKSELGNQPKIEPLVEYVVVPRLPKDALIEWHVYADSEKQKWETEIGLIILEESDIEIEIELQCSTRSDLHGMVARIRSDTDQPTDAVSFLKKCFKDNNLKFDSPTWRIFYRDDIYIEQDLAKEFKEHFPNVAKAFIPVHGFTTSRCVLSICC